ncbi:type II toxin-antitoxin system VapC family toxin [Patulibacter minatonensis]|uniref:type II toxin-antitoxin system VapC family toxin n=1 Tax=Patulibacter minatonensis TaxID=298163 RepID=UPI00047E0820|nr:PIN domain-containing protein [Patulibacter minatonensis]
MSVVLDTGIVVALMFPDDENHAAAVGLLDDVAEDLVTTPLALAEMDHLTLARVGRHAQEALWNDLDRGVFAIRWWADGLRDMLEVARSRPDIGLVDASLVALAARLHTVRIATFDHRHFRTLVNEDGRPFTLLPADG